MAGFVADEPPAGEEAPEVRHGETVMAPVVKDEQLYTADEVFALIDAAVLATQKKYRNK